MKKSRQPGSNAMRRLRWPILLLAVVAAVAWRRRSALALLPGRTVELVDRTAAGALDRLGSSVVDASWGSRNAPVPVVIDAGVDAGGTFRPARVEPDAYGVVVTDPSPAGLEAAAGWVEGDGTDVCPETHPIKGNASSRIYHLPGQPSYSKTIAETCFATEEAARTAGYRPRRS